MEILFNVCCDIINTIANIINISYGACNILIFLYILPCFYFILTFLVGISAFFKKSKFYKIICLIFSYFGCMYQFEFIWRILNEFKLDNESFNKAVDMLYNDALWLGISYIEINILYFIIIPILIIPILILMIIVNNV